MLSYHNCLADPRLAQRANGIAAAMAEHQSVVIRRITRTRAEAAGAYRFFNNPNVSTDHLTSALIQHCQSLVNGQHLLVLQDTTQLNFEHLAQRLGQPHHLGVIGDNESLGCFLHPSLVIEADTGYALGLSDVQLWTRAKSRSGKKRSKRRPIEEKESFRWLKSITDSQAVLAQAERVTMIADREGDIFEVLARVPDARTDVLIRVKTNRRVVEAAGLLYDHVQAQPVAGRYRITLPGDARRPRQGREAEIAVRIARVHLLRPHRLRGSDYPEQVRLYTIEAKEEATSVPEGEPPIHWRLVTSHVVEDLESARQVLTWYTWRWHIEQYFRLLKSQGLNLEQAQLEDGRALKRLSLMALGAALQVLRLMQVRQGGGAQPAIHVFSASEQACLAALMPEWEGSTRKQQNGHDRGSLAWASWLIARLGGWKGYRSERPPGPITYYRGLYRFASLYQGWRLAQV